MPLLQTSSVSLYYELSGPQEAAPVVFLSGLTGDHNNWQLQVRSLESSYRCLTFDWRDTGQSGASPVADYGLSEMAADVVGLLDGLRLNRAHLVGLSMGGAVAQLVGLDFPTRTASLTLASSFSVRPVPLELPANRRTLGNLRHREAVRRHDTAARLPALNVPTLVIAGSRDQTTPPADQQAYAARLPAASFRLIEGAGHLVQVEKAGEFNRLLKAFLAEHPIIDL